MLTSRACNSADSAAVDWHEHTDRLVRSVNPINLDTLYLPECDRPFREYFWFNELHPAHKVHQLMASALYEDCFQDKKPREHCS